MTVEEHRDWAHKLWNRMDRDHSDEITKDELSCDEFQAVLRSLLAPEAAAKGTATYGRSEINLPQALSYCLATADKNIDGVLSFREFESFLRFLRNETGAEHIASVTFALFDLDHDGKIDKEEFREIYRYFLGNHPTGPDFKKAWENLDPAGFDAVTKQQYTKWLHAKAPAVFKQHAAPVLGSAPSSVSGGDGAASPSRSPKKVKPIHRPAPGCLPPRAGRKPSAPDFLPEWNPRFASKDPSEQNKALRGNLRMKSYFMRPQSLPELHRFYCTYQGFETNRQKLIKPEPLPDWRKLVLSTDNLTSVTLPGAERHKPGGSMRNRRGEAVPWAENTPRALIRPVWAPGSLLLRVPGPPAPFLAKGREAGE